MISGGTKIDGKDGSQDIPCFTGEIVDEKIDIPAMDQAPDAYVPSFGLFQKLVSGLFGSSHPSKTHRLLDRLGLLDHDGRMRSGRIAQYQTLFERMRKKKLPGIKEPALAIPVDTKSAPLSPENAGLGYNYHETPNIFLAARKALTTAKKEDFENLTRFYAAHLNRALSYLDFVTEYIFDSNSFFDDRPDWVATLVVIMEALKDEGPELIGELKHHINLPLLFQVRDGLQRRMGPKPALWDDAIAAYKARNEPPEGIFGNRSVLWSDHPLLKRTNVQPPQKVGGRPPADFTQVDTPDGTRLFYNYRQNPETSAPEVVITGDVRALALITQMLSIANGGDRTEGDRILIFPLNKAEEQIRHMAQYIFTNIYHLSNGTTFAFGFNEETMLHEMIYTRPKEQHIPGLHQPELPLLDPAEIIPLWERVLNMYAMGLDYEPEMLIAVKDTASILYAVRDAARHADPDFAERIEGMLKNEKNLVKLNENLPHGVWHVEAGLRLNRQGEAISVIIKFFDRHPVGMWGIVEDLKAYASAVVVEGRPDGNRNITWSQMRHRSTRANSTLLHEILGTMFTGRKEARVVEGIGDMKHSPDHLTQLQGAMLERFGELPQPAELPEGNDDDDKKGGNGPAGGSAPPSTPSGSGSVPPVSVSGISSSGEAFITPAAAAWFGAGNVFRPSPVRLPFIPVRPLALTSTSALMY